MPNVIGPHSKDKRTTIGAHSADKSMAIGPHTIDKYNMMMVEERTRQLLSNDERDAVLRHIKNVSCHLSSYRRISKRRSDVIGHDINKILPVIKVFKLLEICAHLRYC